MGKEDEITTGVREGMNGKERGDSCGPRGIDGERGVLAAGQEKKRRKVRRVTA